MYTEETNPKSSIATINIVEDQLLVSEALQVLLARRGFRVRNKYQNAEPAIKHLSLAPLDMDNPEIDSCNPYTVFQNSFHRTFHNHFKQPALAMFTEARKSRLFSPTSG